MRPAVFTLIAACLMGCLCFLVSCASSADVPSDEELTESVAGKTFVWEKEGFGGDFTITLDTDGRYEFYEGFLSSYIGSGNWTVEGGVLTMTEDPENGYPLEFRFEVRDGELFFLADGSDKFIYTEVEDGDRFLPRET